MYLVSGLSSANKCYPLRSSASKAFRPLAGQMSSYQLTSVLNHRLKANEQRSRQTCSVTKVYCLVYPHLGLKINESYFQIICFMGYLIQMCGVGHTKVKSLLAVETHCSNKGNLTRTPQYFPP